MSSVYLLLGRLVLFNLVNFLIDFMLQLRVDYDFLQEQFAPLNASPVILIVGIILQVVEVSKEQARALRNYT